MLTIQLFSTFTTIELIDAVDFHEQTEYFKAGLVVLKEVLAEPPTTTRTANCLLRRYKLTEKLR